MIISTEQAKYLAKKFNEINNDSDRLAFLKCYNRELIVVLDNNHTDVAFIIDPFV